MNNTQKPNGAMVYRPSTSFVFSFGSRRFALLKTNLRRPLRACEIDIDFQLMTKLLLTTVSIDLVNSIPVTAEKVSL